MGCIDERFVVDDATKEVRVLHHHQGGVEVNLVDQVLQVWRDAGFGVISDDADGIIRLHVAANDFAILWIDSAGKQNLAAFAAEVIDREDNRFGSSSRAVIVGSVTDVHAS